MSDENSLISTSARRRGKSSITNAAKDIVADSLIPVKLDPDTESLYNNAFFPRNKPSKTNRMSIRLHHTLINYLGSLGDSFERMFDWYRLLLTYGDTLDTSTPEEIEQFLKTNSTALTTPRNGAIKAAVKAYYVALTSGKNHVIRRSSKYKGGFDIEFVGDPSSNATTLTVPMNDHTIRGAVNSVSDFAVSNYESTALAKYSTPRSLQVVDCAKTVLERLFPELGANSIEAGDKRIITKLGLDFDFKSLEDIFPSKTGLSTEGTFISDNLSSEIISNLKDFVSILVIRNPQKEVLKSSVSNLTRKQKFGLDDKVVDTKATKEGISCYPNLSFSLVFHLPEDVARFITQTPEGKPVPLSVLNNWVRIWAAAILRQPGARASGAATLGGKRIKKNRLPRYILPGSQIAEINKIRKDNDYYIEQGRTNDENLYVAADGTLKYCPKSGDVSNDNIIRYEQDLEAVVNDHFEKGIPLDFSRKTVSSYYAVEQGDIKISDTLHAEREGMFKHAGKMLNYTWDYDVQLNVNPNDPSTMVPNSLVGATQPDSMVIADYLGYNYAEEGETPDKNSFADTIQLLLADTAEAKSRDENLSAMFFSGDSFAGIPSIQLLTNFYGAMAVKGQAPTFQTLLEQVKTERGLTSLNDDKIEANIYARLFSNEFAIRDTENVAGEKTGEWIRKALSYALNNAAGLGNSTIRTSLMAEGLMGQTLEEEIEESSYYFELRGSTMRDFGNLYSYVGGLIFKKALEYIVALSAEAIVKFEYEPLDTQTVNTEGRQFNFNTISSIIMPLATMFVKYVPEADRYFAEADALTQQFKPDDNIDETNIQIPGLREGTQMFPHQINTHKSIRNRPKAAIFDIHPGGGKTILGITDAAAAVKEMEELGTRVKPLMLAPDNLVKNWCDDLTKFLGSNWNVIPLTTKVYRSWGEERLLDMLRTAPINTIVVAGLNFLKSQTFPIVLGASVTVISGPVEFIKRLGYNYILIDESHKVKNLKSDVHNVVKQLTTMSIVKFIRLATGTLISNKLTDIVGQTATVTAHVFRTAEQYEEEYSVLEGGKVVGWLPDTAERARRKLNHYASVVTMKRKEWAFMLPNPIERFHSITLNTTDDDPAHDPNSELHLQVYNAVLEETLEVLQAALKRKNATANSEDDSDASEDGAPDVADASDEDNEMDFDFDDNEQLAGLEALLRPYLQRLEQILTDPLGDPLGQEIFKRAGVEKYTSRKVQKVINIIDGHYNVEQWSDQKSFRELDLVGFNGKNYLLRKQQKDNPAREVVVNNGRNPEEDTDTWKWEPEGKIIIFCRYVRTVNVIYDALPEKFKSIARKFSGDEGNTKYENLQAFKSDPSVQILVAVEMAITEGHNLQMASRMIRVEQPWAPGDLDQSSARIFRPDPAAAKAMVGTGKPGELYREVIFLDWVMAQGTMEVAKFGRLISKIISKTQFDEAGNDAYDSIKDVSLPVIPMDLDTLARSTVLKPELDDLGNVVDQQGEDIGDYVDTYATVRSIQMMEFTEMRSKEDIRMYDITPADNLAGSRRIENVPLLPDQEIADPDNFGLVKGRDFLNDPKHIEYKQDPSRLVGLPIKTELGTGIIVGVAGDRLTTPSAISIRLNSDDELYKFPITKVYIATNVNESNKNLFTTSKPWATETQRKRMIKEQNRELKDFKDQEEKDEKERLRREAAELRKAEKAAEASKRAKKRKENKRKGKPLNDGVRKGPIKRKPIGKDDVIVPDETADKAVSLEASVYNGFIAAIVDASDADAPNLKSLDFKQFGPYAYVEIHNYRRLEAVFDYIEDNFTLSPATERRLELSQDSFEEGKGERFNADLVPLGELQNFFKLRHRKPKGRKEIKVYPIMQEDSLVLAVDIATNPSIVKHIGKSVPKAALKWKRSEGAAIYFAQNKTDAKRVPTKLRQAGYTVTNKEDYIDALEGMKVRRIKRR